MEEPHAPNVKQIWISMEMSLTRNSANMRPLLLIFALLICISCNNKKKDDNTATSKTTHKEKDIINENKVVDNSIFIFEDDTLAQQLTVKKLTPKALDYVLRSTNKRDNKSTIIEGIAMSEESNDLETDEDEEGEAYPATAYIDQKKCWISFRVDAETKDKIRIVEEADCMKLHDVGSPFASPGILRQMKK
jgi:hypothetical protein